MPKILCWVSWENFLFGYPENAGNFFFSCLFMVGFIWIFALCCHFPVFLWKEILDFLGKILNNLQIRIAIKKYRFILILVKDIK